MKNREIIAIAAVKSELYSVDEVKKMLENNEEIPLHTISGWNKIGKYKVKKGEKAIEAMLWRKKDDGTGGYYKTKSYLYGQDQVEKMM